jgi:DNA invertase Pin-like site-specific DNA recombinase
MGRANLTRGKAGSSPTPGNHDTEKPLGIDLYLHQQHVDTTTPSGRALFQMMGVFAEFERAMIRERVNAGLARARAKGKILGRPKVKPAVEKRIRELRAKGMGMVAIGRALKVGTATVQRVLAESDESLSQ